jgi:NTP pyrophosphatase (non-canonical NTP hydrolase)
MGNENRSGPKGDGESGANGGSSQGFEKEVGDPSERLTRFRDLLSLDNPVFSEIAKTMSEPNFAHVFARFPDLPQDQLGFFYYSSCLMCEAAEVFNHAKKSIVKGDPIDKDKIAAELVDVLWYTYAVANLHHIQLTDAAQAKCEELIKRIRSDYYKGRSQDA